MSEKEGGATTPVTGVADGPQFDSIGLDWALAYSREGWAVFPCHSIVRAKCTCPEGAACEKGPGKHPRTRNGVKDATTDEARIRGWWARWPNANVAIAMGGDLNLVAVDIDPRKGGSESALELADTLKASTGGAGKHYIYTSSVPISNRGEFVTGIDFKSEGGYIIAAPSNHASGGRYDWINWGHTIEPLPQSVLDAISGAGSSSQGGSTGFDFSNVLNGLNKGERNDMLFRYACWLRRTFREDRQVVEFNVRFVNARSSPPLGDSEVDTIVGSAFKQDHDVVREGAMAWVQSLNTQDGWDEPIPLVTNENLPPFPIEALPPTLKNMAVAVAEANQVPVDLAASMGLAALAASLVGRVTTRINESWTETANVYVLGLIDSGNRKSSTQARMVAPLIAMQKVLQLDARDRIAHGKARKKRLFDVAKAAATALRKDPTNADLIRAAESANFDAEEYFVESLPLLLVSDATPEAIGMRLAEQDERLAVFDAEGGGLITMMGARYSGKGTPSNLDMLLKAHDGGATTVTRVGREEPMVLDSPQLTIGVLSQPETLREVMGVSGAFDRGLVARMMILAPPDILGSRKTRTTPVPEAIEMAYTSMLGSFVQTLWPLVDSEELKMEPAAVERLLLFAESIEPRLARDGDLRPLGGFAGKIVGAAARYATLHHLGWYGPAGLNIPVNEGSVAKGIAMAEYTVDHYRYVMAATGFVAEIAIADRIIRWLKRDQRSEFKRRDVQKSLRIERVDELDDPLVLLEEHGFIRSLGVKRNARAGRNPSDSFSVNPAIWRP